MKPLFALACLALLACALLAAFHGCTCPAPTITALNPSSGPPGTLVDITGNNLTLTTVVWDAGLPAEDTLPTSLSGKLFNQSMGKRNGEGEKFFSIITGKAKHEPLITSSLFLVSSFTFGYPLTDIRRLSIDKGQ